MDTSLLLHRPAAPKPKLKRPCCSPFPDSTRNPNSNPNQNPLDALLESFLELSDSSAIALDLSFDRILESKAYDSDKNDVIERALRLGSALTEAAKRSARRRASMHNAAVWGLPSDLTIKVFSMLDTQSVCHAAATCSFFHKCAADPLCYSNIDLTTVVPKVNNMVVSTMIQRAGKVLRSLKLGVVPCPTVASLGSSQSLVYSMRNSSDTSGFSWNDKRSRQGKESFILTRSCLAPLIADGGAPGALLRRLHLYNIERMDNTAFGAAVSACPSLLDLEIVGLHVELRQTLESVSRSCPLIERLFFESSKTGRDDSLKLPTCNDLVTNCPNLSSLALRGFKLHDVKVRVLVKGFRKLKYVDFSTSYSITGDFLRNLGGSIGGSLLEVLILRDCMHLREVRPKFSLPIYLSTSKKCYVNDVSNREGLASDDDWYRRCFTPSFMSLRELLEERPNLCVLADFPAEGSFVEEPMTSSDLNSDTNSPSLSSSRTSEEYVLASPSDSSYSSDQSSGNEDTPSSSYPIHEESSDESIAVFLEEANATRFITREVWSGVTGVLFCVAAEYIFRPCGVSGFIQPSTSLLTFQSLPTVRRVSSTLRLASATFERILARHRVPVRSPIRNAHFCPRLSARTL
ncbi:UNVERIFIED_CONTAM: F-box protein SKIP17 [Sesamum radiatum]|uniref:F-box protein SKIP17 n=1 Tax=Sesamum radiatum TaxID=300843 RepID=A0AAW2W2C1_SESRA